MMRSLLTVSIRAAVILQFCAAVAAPEVSRPTEATLSQEVLNQIRKQNGAIPGGDPNTVARMR